VLLSPIMTVMTSDIKIVDNDEYVPPVVADGLAVWEEVLPAANLYKTPFHLYRADDIKRQCLNFYKAFDWTKEKKCSFKNYFAVKATPTPAILRLVNKYKMGFDCSSLGELILCKRLGFTGEDIMFTSNNTRFKEYRKAAKMGAIINLDDYSQIACLEKALAMGGIPFPSTICFRYNPGPRRTGSVFIGEPVEAKYGLTRDQLFAAYTLAKTKGAKRFGLHTMVASNSLDVNELVSTIESIFTLVVELHTDLDIKMEFVNFGGGVGVRYRPEEKEIDFNELGMKAKELYETIIEPAGLGSIDLMYECGRVITAQAGVLVSRVQNMKDTYKRYVGVDATMADLMRPGMYGAYHHINMIEDSEQCKAFDLPDFSTLIDNKDYVESEIIGKKQDLMYDVVGSLCENNDKFSIDRVLNKDPRIGDLCIIHTTGAHGRAMGFNYNAKLRCGEYLIPEGSKEAICIRRPEKYQDYFATVNFDMACPAKGSKESSSDSDNSDG